MHTVTHKNLDYEPAMKPDVWDHAGRLRELESAVNRIIDMIDMLSEAMVKQSEAIKYLAGPNCGL